MTKDQTNTHAQPQPERPHPALKRLDVLVGKWDLKGQTLDAAEDNISGWNIFEWLPGGFFLKSAGEINFKGVKFQTLEIIAYDPSTNTFPSSVYSSMGGSVLQYSWDVQGSTVIHSDATSKYTGTLTEDGRTLSGGWRPKEGEKESPENSYDAVMTRVK